MRRLILTTLFLLLTVGSAAQVSRKDYVDPEGAFAVRIRSDWKPARGPLGEVGWITQFSAENADRAGMTVFVVPSEQALAPEMLDEVGRTLVSIVLDQLGQRAEIQDQKTARVKFGAGDALRCDVTYALPGAGVQQGMMIALLGRKNALLGMVTAPKADAAALKEAEALLLTLAVESRAPGGAAPAAGPGLFTARDLVKISIKMKENFQREPAAQVLVEGEPPLTHGSVAAFLELVGHCFDVEFTEVERELTRRRFEEFYRKADPQGRAIIAQGGQRILGQLREGTPEEQAAKKAEVRATLEQRFAAGAQAGIEWAQVLHEALRRRTTAVASAGAAKPEFAQQGKLDNTLSEADLDASLEMLYFMWVASGRDAALVTPEAVAVVRVFIAQGFPRLGPELQYLFANAEKVYARMRAAWVQANPLERQLLAQQFSQALDAMGLTVPKQQGTGSAWDDVAGQDPSSIRAELVQTTCWNLAQKATQ